jgi:hypothetical protein
MKKFQKQEVIGTDKIEIRTIEVEHPSEYGLKRLKAMGWIEVE